MLLDISTLEPASYLAICAMIGTLVFAYLKKLMMTYALIIANIIVFVIGLFYLVKLSNGQYISLLSIKLGFQPIFLTDNVAETYTIFTSMFAHSGFLHLIGNMLVLFFVGMAFEQRIGRKKFLAIYLISGVAATLTHSLLNINSDIPLVGASGAIFGIMGAFAFSYPYDEVIMPIPLGIIMVLRRIKVIYAVILFAILETVIVFIDVPDGTAHYAHLGGLIGGIILAAVILKGRKTHTKSGQTIFYDSYHPKTTDKMDLLKLDPLATTPELKEMLLKIKNENVPQVRDIWLEYFIEKAACPKCGDRLFRMDNKIWCERCGFKTKI